MSGEYDDEDTDPMIVDSLDAKLAHRYEDVDNSDIPRDSLDDSPVGKREGIHEQENLDPNMQLNESPEHMDTDPASPDQNEPYDNHALKEQERQLSRNSRQRSHPGSGTQSNGSGMSPNDQASNNGSPPRQLSGRSDYGRPPRGPSAGSRGPRSGRGSGSAGSKRGSGFRPSPGSRGSNDRGTPPQQLSPGVQSQGSGGSVNRNQQQQLDDVEDYPPNETDEFPNKSSPQNYSQPMQYDDDEEEDEYGNPPQTQKEEGNESPDSLEEEERYQAALRERLAKSLHDIRKMEEEKEAARARAEARARSEEGGEDDAQEEGEAGEEPDVTMVADSLDPGASNDTMVEDSLDAGSKDVRRDEDDRFVEQPTPRREDGLGQQMDDPEEDQFFGVPKRLSAHSQNRLGSSTLPKSGDSSKRQSYIKEQNQQSFLKHGEISKGTEDPPHAPPPDDPAEEVRVEYISEESDDDNEHFVDEKGSPVDNQGRPLYGKSETASAKSLSLSEQRRQFVLKSRHPKPPSHPNSVEAARRKYSGARTPGSGRRGSGSSAKRKLTAGSSSSQPNSERPSSQRTPPEERYPKQEYNQRTPASREQVIEDAVTPQPQVKPVAQTPQLSQGYQTPQQVQIPQGYQAPPQPAQGPPPAQFQQPPPPQQFQQYQPQQFQQQPLQQQFPPPPPPQQQHPAYRQQQDPQPQQYGPPFHPQEYQQQPLYTQPPSQPYQQPEPYYSNQHTSPPQFHPGYGPVPPGALEPQPQQFDPRYQQVHQRHPSFEDPRYRQVQRQEEFDHRRQYQGPGPSMQTPPQPWQARPSQQGYSYGQPEEDIYQEYERPPFPPPNANSDPYATDASERYPGNATNRSQNEHLNDRPRKYKSTSPAKPAPDFINMNRSNIKREPPRKTYAEIHAKKMVTPPLNPNAPLPNISRESSEDVDPESVWAQRSRSLQKFKKSGSKQGNAKKSEVTQPWTKQLVSEQRNLPLRTRSDTALQPKKKMLPVNPSPRANRQKVNLDINVNIKRLDQSQEIERDNMDIDVQVTPRPDHFQNYENPYLNPNIREPPPQNFGQPRYNIYARQSSEPVFSSNVPMHLRRYSEDSETYRSPRQPDPRDYGYDDALNPQEFYEETPRLSYTHPLDQHATNPYGVLPDIHKDDRGSRASQEGGYLAMMQKKKEPPNYKQYTLKDYRSLKSDLRMGGLGPDHGLMHERQEKANRGREYARQVAEQNKRTFGQHPPRRIPRPSDGPEQSDIHSKRHVSLVYAKHVPKPKVKAHSSSSTPVVDEDQIKSPRALAIEYSKKIKKPVAVTRSQWQGHGQGQTEQGSPEHERSPSKYSHLEEDMAKLEELQARHERERQEIEKLNHQVPTQS
ncbi:RNA-binding protein 33-like isoform X1 [Ptychodera flava]|uniref:RNA-binding protein 33-like isoform X1 n=1 Tax=Ptychodera flava TaxID=63121 RepID=UPI00396A58CF